MIRARVVGEIWATRKAPGLSGRKLLLCAVDGDPGRVVVGIDTLDAGVGDDVLVSWGSGARNALIQGPAGCDAARPGAAGDPGAPRGTGPALDGPDNRQLLCDAALSLVIDGGTDRGSKEER